MKRNLLKQLLQNYTSTYAEEQVFKNDMLAFIEEHEDCFERSLLKGHITASSWLLNKDGSKALLMHHKKLGIWIQLGGHCDGEHDVLAVAIKEAQEESGIQHIVPVSEEIFDIGIHVIPEHKGIPAHYHYDVRFLLRVASDEQIVQNHESHELRWIGAQRTDLPTNEPAVIRMFDKWVDANLSF